MTVSPVHVDGSRWQLAYGYAWGLWDSKQPHNPANFADFADYFVTACRDAGEMLVPRQVHKAWREGRLEAAVAADQTRYDRQQDWASDYEVSEP